MRGAIPIALAGTASALQIPLQLPQLPKKLQWSSGAAHVDVDSLPQIESQALQDTIEIANLKKRAERLYDIAKLSESEYNHPTRVIGSRGRS